MTLASPPLSIPDSSSPSIGSPTQMILKWQTNGLPTEAIFSMNAATPGSRLRELINNSPEILVCPGVYDGISARAAINLGFKGMYMVS